jgi:predicted DNA-binding transcriptional regulator AlpA
MKQKYLSDREVAAQLGISRSTAWRWSDEGVIPPFIKLGPATTRMDAEALNACLTAKCEPDCSAPRSQKALRATAASLAARGARNRAAAAAEAAQEAAP